MSSERKKYESDVLRSVETDINAMYSQIHPNENISFSKLELDEGKTGSVHIHCRFENKENANTFKYLSESHLNTLGICLFIALAKQEDSKILVLDDVLTSVDRQHLRRCADLMDSLSTNNTFEQIIITTHLRDWQMFYKTNRNPAYNVNIINLKAWSKEAGIRHTKVKPDLDLLKQLAADPDRDRQVIASKAGIMLESLCDFLTETYQCSVPRKELTLGDYRSSFSSQLLSALEIEKTGTRNALANKITAALQDTWVRNNVGSHFKLESTITDSEVDTFAQNTISLAETIICPACGQMPTKDGNSFWKCSCPAGSSIKMYPHTRP